MPAVSCAKAAREYWAANSDLKRAHPHVENFDLAIPLRIYGDGAEPAQGQHFEATTRVTVLLGSGKSTLDTRFLCAVRNTLATDDIAVLWIADVMRWSFDALRCSNLKFLKYIYVCASVFCMF